MTTSNYPGSQPALYQVCRTLWANCQSNLADFTAFKPAYDAALITSRLASITASEAMPTEQARTLTHETKRQDMMELSKTCLQQWQYLKRYIAAAYATEYHDMNWNAAGWSHYSEAANQNWEQVRALMNEGSLYISQNNATLSANENMPAGFSASFRASELDFNAAYDAFLQAEETARLGTENKITANNDIYAQAIELCLDGQAIYTNSGEIKRLFSFEAVSELVSPRGASTLVVTVTTDDMPLAGAEISINGSDRTVTTDGNGRAEIGQLAAGNITGNVAADGYNTMPYSITLETGTTGRIAVAMTPLFTGELKVGPITTPVTAAPEPIN